MQIGGGSTIFMQRKKERALKSNFLRVSRIERQSRKIEFFLFRPNIPLGELI